MSYSKYPCPKCGRLIETRSKLCKKCHKKFAVGPNSSNWKGGITEDHYHWKKIQVQRYPEKDRARLMVHYAVKTGKLVKTGCQWPGCEVEPNRTQFHHWSYDPGRELDVLEVCRAHHEQVKSLSKEQFQFFRAVNSPELVIIQYRG